MSDKENKTGEEIKYTYYLADCELTVFKKHEEFVNSLVLTRAFIHDTELQKKSDTDKIATTLGDLQIGAGTGEEIVVEQPSPSAVDFSSLPIEFGNPKQGQKKYSKKKWIKKNNNGAAEWLLSTSFAEYWEHTHTYIIYFTWMKLVEERLEEDKLKEMKEITEKSKPDQSYAPLIEEHMEDSLLANYVPLTKSEPNYSEIMKKPEEHYAIHCQKVYEQARKDFGQFKSRSIRKRCSDFFIQVNRMGFCAGVKDEDIKPSNNLVETSDDDINSASSSEVMKSLDNNLKSVTICDESPPRKKSARFPIVYGDDEVFANIDYDIYDKLAERGRNFLGPKREKALASDSKDSGIESVSSEPINIKNVSFKFDPNTEPYLLASNAHLYYKNDPEMRKYFYQRYRLFSKLDEGVIMDREGWFSVTPERIANHIAERIVTKPGMVVVDAFAGVGGNSIQFALQGARVIAIDLDPTRLKCAYQNAKVYGVEDKIEFICCDFFHFASKWTKTSSETTEHIDAVFLSPPWGGPSYMDAEEFRLDEGITPDGFDIFYASRRITPNIAYFLPKNTSVKQLLSLVDRGSRLEIEQSCLNKKVKLITAYYGNLASGNN